MRSRSASRTRWKQHLLRGLRRDAAERAPGLTHVEHGTELLVLLPGTLGVLRVPEHLETELLPELRLEAMLLRHVQGNLPLRIRNLLGHGHVLEEVDRTRVLAVTSLELARGTERGLCGLQYCRFHGLDQDLSCRSLFLPPLGR